MMNIYKNRRLILYVYLQIDIRPQGLKVWVFARRSSLQSSRCSGSNSSKLCAKYSEIFCFFQTFIEILVLAIRYLCLQDICWNMECWGQVSKQ